MSKVFVVFSLKKSGARRRKEPERCNVLSFISRLEFRGGVGPGNQSNHKDCYHFTDSHLIYDEGKSPILWPLSGKGTLTLQKVEEKVPYTSVSKRHWFFNSTQDTFCETGHIVSSIVIRSITSFLWEVTTVKLEICRNQGELRYLKSYRITLLHYRCFYRSI